MKRGVPILSVIDGFIQTIATCTLHAFMRRGWKKSSLVKLTVALATSIIVIGVIFLALMADRVNMFYLALILIASVFMGKQSITQPFAAMFDRKKRPFMPRFGWIIRSMMVVNIGMIVSLFFWQPETLRSLHIPFWAFTFANAGFLVAMLLMTGLFYLMAAAPLGYQPDSDSD